MIFFSLTGVETSSVNNNAFSVVSGWASEPRGKASSWPLHTVIASAIEICVNNVEIIVKKDM